VAKLNFGLNTPKLHLEIDITPPADIEAFTAAILPGCASRMEVPEQWLRDRLQIPAARPGRKMLKAPFCPAHSPAGITPARSWTRRSAEARPLTL
jgi:phage gp29-like protein